MECQVLFNQLRVVPEYTVHIVSQDEVVVLYNSRRPLLLQGREHVLLFQILQHQIDLHTFSEPGKLRALALRAVQLIEQRILIIEPEEVDVHQE